MTSALQDEDCDDSEEVDVESEADEELSSAELESAEEPDVESDDPLDESELADPLDELEDDEDDDAPASAASELDDELDVDAEAGRSRNSCQIQPVLLPARTWYQPPLRSSTSTSVLGATVRCTAWLIPAPERMLTPSVVLTASESDAEAPVAVAAGSEEPESEESESGASEPGAPEDLSELEDPDPSVLEETSLLEDSGALSAGAASASCWVPRR